ncbi:MAG TPA: family 10 glycosylhydrolase [Gemmatimonadaceae bacterium]|jgi:uncharacterized lipoprotein YddW (UPF0748 family)|nr:family 10 glycosylhydrolase [Gemmatimonadaceae bacterium]
MWLLVAVFAVFAATGVFAAAPGTVGAQSRQPVTAPPPVPREFRGAWATPMWDRGFKDWPSAPGLTPDSQRTELRAMLDHAAAIGLNAIILHVRLAGDAMYPTPFAPWSAYLTGKSGQAPSPMYDPLAFAVAEAHARGLQLHAWFNPFRAMLPIFAGKAAPTHVTRLHPDWVRKYGTETWIDPGDPQARAFVLATMLDVVKRYDVDGIHIDDYFYPYREARTVTRRVKAKRIKVHVPIVFPDDRTWKKYGRASGFTDRDAWRRANIDDFVHALYTGVKAIKPSVIVGISPFGIWRTGTPRGVTGLDAYEEIYADSKRWLAEGWLDYLSPQLYWPVGGEEDRFRALDAWWRSENPRGRFIWPGLYDAHVYGGRDPWPAAEIKAQVDFLRAARPGADEAQGQLHFRLAALFADNDAIGNVLSSDYATPALVPAFPWLGSTPPAPPQLHVVSEGGRLTFNATPSDTVSVRWWLIQTRGRSGAWVTTLRPAGDGRLAASAFGTTDPDEVAVTAIGVSGMASAPSIIQP